ncbi:JAB domain-containing protein [Aestuariivivens sediminis]|uniref:JAB domain-containing protein n=1 Tax=Aestuariivivens sediminis TaxID=2913557 RepID=UPI001F5959F7|nr:JAB domain-containing protein [Aestuariivivens sediminis]
MKNVIAEIQLKYNNTRGKEDRIKITDSRKAYDTFLHLWDLDTIELYEEFKVLLLNRANEVLGIHTLSKGCISGTLVDLKLLFVVALRSASCGIIMAHNHPSGNLKPSEVDKRLYEKIKKAAEYLDINVLDNLIISKYGYYSFTDEGL